ncbi:MAG: hypothetical protein R2822_08725 [Spirosomataceae bacterium]
MVQKITTNAPHLLWKEVQIDCDWTVATKAKYFRLLQQISALLPPSVILSATIRLHQIKFYRTTGDSTRQARDVDVLQHGRLEKSPYT